MCVQEVLDSGENSQRESVKGSLGRREIQKERIMKVLSAILTLRVVLLCHLIHLFLVPPLFADSAAHCVYDCVCVH